MSGLKIAFLGTGAAVPSPRRGLPSLALIRDNLTILCDCAEGTQMRLSSAKISPSKIRFVCISHLHGDHLFGLPGFLTTQQMMSRTAPLAIISPVGLQRFLDCVRKISGFHIEYELSIEEVSKQKAHSFQAGSFAVTAKPLQHSIFCLGYRFAERPKPGKFDEQKAQELGIPIGPVRGQLQKGLPVILSDGRQILPQQVVGPSRPGRVVVYCTDTRPCQAAIELAQDCDVLIHDSTFSEANREEAEVSFHSTAIEAAEVAAQARAKKLILWHISGRNDKAREIDLLHEARTVFSESYLPEDFEFLEVPRTD